MPTTQRYTNHLDTLIALTTHLALTTSEYRSRTAPNLAKELSLERADIELVFSAFPGLFRKSEPERAREEHYYSLRARWALQPSGGDDQPPPTLQVDVLKALLEFISQRAQAEREERQFSENARRALINTRVAAAAALIAAIATVVTAIIHH